MNNLDKNKIKEFTLRIGKGVIISILITFILLFIFSILLTFTKIGEDTIKPIVIIISMISVLIGSSISTLKINKKGILNGGVIGIIYIISIYILSSITGGDFSLNVSSLLMIGLSVIAGLIGGIIGVNL